MVDRGQTVDTATSLARELAERFELAGLAVGIVEGDEVIHAEGFGVQSLATGSPITPDSMFRLASLTKPFVATAVLQLVEAGEVRLDAPVVDYLPAFRVGDERQIGLVTVRHLLRHASGLPRSYHDPEPPDDRAHYLRRNAGVRLAAAPGEQFLYSNLGYDILGEVVAEVSGHAFEDYLRDRVLAPAGMPTSTFPPAPVDPSLVASPHLNGPQPILARVDPPHPANNPSKGLVSSTRELCNWAITTLHLGRFGDRRILDATGYDELLSPPPSDRSGGEPDPETSAAGLGWFLGTRHGLRTVHKGGSLTGYGSSLILAPDQALGVVVLSNSHPVPKDAIAAALLDVLLGHAPELPKPLVLHEIYPTLVRDGQQAAVARHHALRAERPDDYDFGGGQYYQIGWANLLTALGRPKEATEVIGLGAALNPDSDAYHHLLALAHNECGEFAQAISSLERCLALNPGHQGAGDLLAELRRG